MLSRCRPILTGFAYAFITMLVVCQAVQAQGPLGPSGEVGQAGEAFEEVQTQPVTVADPLEPWNRLVFHFNDKLYFWVIKPTARGYNAVTPRFLRVGVRNFFSNVMMPVRLVNCILQWKPRAAGTELAAFLVNTTVGFAGFTDPAGKYMYYKPKDEDLGQTLGKYGIGNGIYIVWPFLGPSTVRDTAGLAGDRFLNPVGYVDPSLLSYGLSGYRVFNDTSFHLGEYESFKEAALEPYYAFRNAYIQLRAQKVRE